jgi:hypothetical protein
MEDVTLDWATATVEDAKLTVELRGELPSAWKKSFERTVHLLGDNEWGKVQVKKQSVRVSEVTRGNADKLRHYLEGVVDQANSALRAGEDEAKRRQDDGGAGDGPDAELTEHFRAYAEQEAES